MSQAPEDTALIAQLLESQQALLGKLQQTLEQEQQALAKRDVDTVARVSQYKQQLSDQLEQQANEFRSLLAARRIPDGAEALQQFFRQAGLEQAWQNFLNQLENCHKLNAISGQVVEQSMRVNSRILNVLLGQGQANTYSPSGEISQGDHQNTLIKA